VRPVFVPIASFPAFRTLFRKFRGKRSAPQWLIAALNALNYRPVVRVVSCVTGRGTASWVEVLGGIDWCAIATPESCTGWCRMALLSLVRVLVFAGGSFGIR